MTKSTKVVWIVAFVLLPPVAAVYFAIERSKRAEKSKGQTKTSIARKKKA